jgi:SAM-dependent methyltransferase
VYARDLAFVHDSAFGDFSRRVGPEILTILRSAGVRSGRIVEVGCGSGLLAARLSAAGYEVLGYDVSPAMIALAKRRVPHARFRVGNLKSLPLPNCDAVICVGEVVTYVSGGLPVLRRFFRRVYDALPPGGLFVFDFLHSARRRTYPVRTIAANAWSMTVQADYDRRTRILRRRIQLTRRIDSRITRSRETHNVRVYPVREMVSSLKRIGFRVSTSRAIGGYQLLPGDTAVVARRPGI